MIDPDLREDPYEFQKVLGFDLVEWRDGAAMLHMPITPQIGNRGGIPHGGVYATLLDTVMGFAGTYSGCAERRKLALTLSLNTQFLSRPRGAVLIAHGRKTGGGARTYFAEGRIEDDTGELIATGAGVFRLRGAV